jgi:hypothetical protein
MVSAGAVILTLKIAVGAVTVLLVLSLLALVAGKPKWHGWINTVFFALTAVTVLGFEIVIRLVRPDLTNGFTIEQREALGVHLGFAVPSAVLLPIMWLTGRWQYKTAHRLLSVVFLILWSGTFVTGVFFLPHSIDPAP